MKAAREPIFNVPTVITAILVVLGLVQAARQWVLPPESDLELLAWFAFIPARYDSTPLIEGAYPGGAAADAWTFVTYALLHGDLLHLGLNGIWLLAFGTPVARRFGTMRFLTFGVVTAAAGAAVHLATHPGDESPMIGASAAVSGCMAAAIRFVFQREGPLGLLGRRNSESYAVAAAPLDMALRDPRILAFLVVWFALNLLFGVGSMSIVGNGQTVAWQAHVGGFLAGLLGFTIFDPVGCKRFGRGGDPG